MFKRVGKKWIIGICISILSIVVAIAVVIFGGFLNDLGNNLLGREDVEAVPAINITQTIINQTISEQLEIQDSYYDLPTDDIASEYVEVRFHANMGWFPNGEYRINESIKRNNVFQFPPTPSRAGYTFMGWRFNSMTVINMGYSRSLGNPIHDLYQFWQVIVERNLTNVIFVAEWIPNLAVTYYANGGHFLNNATQHFAIIHGTPIIEMPLAFRENYVLTGWWFEEETVWDINTLRQVTNTHNLHSITLTARWIRIEA